MKSSGGHGTLRGPLRATCLWLLVGLVAACQVPGTEEIEGDARDGGPLSETITLVTWNTQKMHDPEITQDLTDLIHEHNPDLVFLQEVDVDELSPNGMGGHFARGWSYPWPGGPTIGVLTLSGSEPVGINPRQTLWREFFVTAPKVSLVTEHALDDGETLLAVNVHLLNFEPWDPFMFREQLRDLERVMAGHDGPIVLAGDFNTWNETRLALVEDLARRLELEEIDGFPHGRRTGDLNSAFFNWVFGVEPELPLDRIYSRGFEARSVQLLPEDSSDHRPVLVRLARDPQWLPEPGSPRVASCSGALGMTGGSAPESRLC